MSIICRSGSELRSGRGEQERKGLFFAMYATARLSFRPFFGGFKSSKLEWVVSN